MHLDKACRRASSSATRGVELDQPVALAIGTALRQQHAVFDAVNVALAAQVERFSLFYEEMLLCEI